MKQPRRTLPEVSMPGDQISTRLGRAIERLRRATDGHPVQYYLEKAPLAAKEPCCGVNNEHHALTRDFGEIVLMDDLKSFYGACPIDLATETTIYSYESFCEIRQEIRKNNKIEGMRVIDGEIGPQDTAWASWSFAMYEVASFSLKPYMWPHRFDAIMYIRNRPEETLLYYNQHEWIAPAFSSIASMLECFARSYEEGIVMGPGEYDTGALVPYGEKLLAFYQLCQKCEPQHSAWDSLVPDFEEMLRIMQDRERQKGRA
ncbi:MAG: hypothetical protein AAF909_10950 [Pseudomonadota bacterium]